MKAHTANLINSLVLIGLGLWGYYSTLPEGPESWTVFIPVIFGIVLF